MKKVTRDLIVATITFGGVLMVCQSTFAQVTANNLYLGFQNQAGGGTEDYIINLGAASSIVGQSSVVTLSSDFSLSDFDAVLGSSSSMFGGVVGAASAAVNNNTGDVYLTQLRSGGAGNPAVPGSTVGATMTRQQANNVYSGLGTLANPAVGTGTLDTSKSWESDVEPSGGAGSIPGVLGLNPDSSVSPSTVLYEDLWTSSSSTLTGSKPFTYLGYFTLDLTGGSPKLTFTSTNVAASLTKPLIVSVKKAGSTVTVISSSAVPTHTYQLQYTASLAPTNWINAGSAQVAGATSVTNTDTTATGPQRFYRIMAQ